MNEIKCIFCDIKSDHVVIEENGYKGKKCPQCGLIYISPRPSSDEIIDLYGHDNAQISAESHIAASFSKRLYARHTLKLVRSFVKKGALLEIGAGAGYFLDEARRVGFDPYGLEFNPIQSKHIRDDLGIPCEESTLSTSSFQGKRFDIVYHCDVISHFFDPISEFKKMNAAMNDDSYLIFETGNFGEIDQKYFKHIQRFQYPDHLFCFSTDNIIELLKKTGFDFVAIYRYSILPQLRAIKILSIFKRLIRPNTLATTKEEKYSSHDKGDIKPVARSNSRSFKYFGKKIIRNTHQYLMHVLRYQVGRIAFKKHRPQTIIIVAKKSK